MEGDHQRDYARAYPVRLGYQSRTRVGNAGRPLPTASQINSRFKFAHESLHVFVPECSSSTSSVSSGNGNPVLSKTAGLIRMLHDKKAQGLHCRFQSRPDPVAGEPGNQINRNQVKQSLSH